MAGRNQRYKTFAFPLFFKILNLKNYPIAFPLMLFGIVLNIGVLIIVR
jgi:hypothetical protein